MSGKNRESLIYMVIIIIVFPDNDVEVGKVVDKFEIVPDKDLLRRV